MLQKSWFKILVWFLTSFFFFLASAVVISIFRPGPSEEETMRFMQGMMSAMDRSMMGAAMNIGNDGMLKNLISLSTLLTFPIIVTSIVLGFMIRYSSRGDKNV